MSLKLPLTGFAIGALMLGGVVAANPLSGAAQDSATPASQANETEDANATPIVGAPLLAPAIDLATAQQTALNGQGSAVVTEIGLDGSDGVLVYSISLDNGVEVEIDATTGAVLKSDQAGNAESAGNDQENDQSAGNDQENDQSAGDNQENDESASDDQNDGESAGDDQNSNDQNGDNENDGGNETQDGG